jgi:hypothetical protein
MMCHDGSDIVVESGIGSHSVTSCAMSRVIRCILHIGKDETDATATRAELEIPPWELPRCDAMNRLRCGCAFTNEPVCGRWLPDRARLIGPESPACSQ